MRTLFIGCHVDEELCYAGAIQNTIDKTCVFFTDLNQKTLRDECLKSMHILGVNKRKIYSLDIREQRQDIADVFFAIRNDFERVFTHSIYDRHLHHRIVAEESRRVFNCDLFTYIGPWNGNENPTYFIELSEAQLERKIQALSCYKSQSHRPYMDAEFIKSWARVNGLKCGKLYAEGFKIERLVQ